MRFIKPEKGKTLVILSDLHLGCGSYFNGQINKLEDFVLDRELVNLCNYYSHDDYASKSVEIILNGDILDFLAVPFVEFFDDEFWSEQSALSRLELIYEAHLEVFEAFKSFLSKKNKKIVYLIGNHDIEIVFEKVQSKISEYLGNPSEEQFLFHTGPESYRPDQEVLIVHGHEFEIAHKIGNFEILRKQEGRTYIRPPWGSYYCLHIINKYKLEREFINQIRPIRKYLIHGVLYDTFFTIRFMLAHIYFFIRINFWSLLEKYSKFDELIDFFKTNLELFADYDDFARKELNSYPDSQVVVMGHTHQARHRVFENGKAYINTGTWTKSVNLDLSNMTNGFMPTFAQIDIASDKKDKESRLKINLFEWRGDQELPYREARC